MNPIAGAEALEDVRVTLLAGDIWFRGNSQFNQVVSDRCDAVVLHQRRPVSYERVDGHFGRMTIGIVPKADRKEPIQENKCPPYG